MKEDGASIVNIFSAQVIHLISNNLMQHVWGKNGCSGCQEQSLHTNQYKSLYFKYKY